jgi:hypothetical protein
VNSQRRERLWPASSDRIEGGLVTGGRYGRAINQTECRVFPAELWQFFGIVLVPLIGLIVGSVVYWLRKLDDRQFHIASSSITKADLTDALRPIHERLIRIENGLQNRPSDSTSSPSRWRTL